MKKIDYSTMVAALKKDGKDILVDLTSGQCDMLHMAVGISGESGELLDAVKKGVIYQKPLDMTNIIEELGDLEFFMEGLRQILNISRQETLDANMEKLLTGEKARYKLGTYTNAQAQSRNDKS